MSKSASDVRVMTEASSKVGQSAGSAILASAEVNVQRQRRRLIDGVPGLCMASVH